MDTPQRELTYTLGGSLQTKCHQYWPDPPDVMDCGSFHIQCQSEDCTIAYVSREMLVTNTQVSRSLRGTVEGQVLNQWLLSFQVVTLLGVSSVSTWCQ